VRRRHRTVRALDGVSFTLQRGEIAGYIGPNGAGKSTTIKILAGILHPTAGHCEIGGRVPWKNRIAHVQRLGVVFGQRTQLWWDLPAIESFDLLRDIYNVSQGDYLRARDEMIAMLSLEKFLDVPVRQLSLGQRMRCDLAASLLHSPELLFLDEPTIGLDAVAKLAVRDFIKALNRKRGTTVIVINHGKILSDGGLKELRANVTTDRWLIIDLDDERAEVSDPDAAVIRREGGRVCLRFDPSRVSPAALIARLTARLSVRDLFVQNPPIEEIIAHYYRGTASA
jgi:ABC-2 type transport system ATP-binding protein